MVASIQLTLTSFHYNLSKASSKIVKTRHAEEEDEEERI